MYCTTCGTLLGNQASFCPGCGSTAQADSQPSLTARAPSGRASSSWRPMLVLAGIGLFLQAIARLLDILYLHSAFANGSVSLSTVVDIVSFVGWALLGLGALLGLRADPLARGGPLAPAPPRAFDPRQVFGPGTVHPR